MSGWYVGGVKTGRMMHKLHELLLPVCSRLGHVCFHACLVEVRIAVRGGGYNGDPVICLLGGWLMKQVGFLIFLNRSLWR